MHASSLLSAALTLAATAAATPLNRLRIKAATIANYAWTITNWEASCAADCTYSESHST